MIHSLCFSQKEINTNWKNYINPIFAGLDKSKVPHAILLDYAMEFTDVPSYNGTLTDSTYIDMTVYSNIYKTLLMGKVSNDTLLFPNMHHLAYTWTNERIAKNSAYKNTLVVAGLYYKYSKINPNALNQNKITVSDNKYYDKYIGGVWQNPYQSFKAIAFSPPTNTYNKRNIKIVLPTELMLGNALSEIQKIEINANDGLGYRQLFYSQELSIDYNANGIYDWIFKITMTNNSVLYSKTKVKIDQKFTSQPWKKRNE